MGSMSDFFLLPLSLLLVLLSNYVLQHALADVVGKKHHLLAITWAVVVFAVFFRFVEDVFYIKFIIATMGGFLVLFFFLVKE